MESDRDEQFWRDRMTRSYRLLAERGERPQGIVSLGPDEQDPTAAEVFGLYVVPDARSTGVSWRLVEATAARRSRTATCSCTTGWDRQRSRDWLRKNFGFRTTDDPRPAHPSDFRHGDDEIAMVLGLEPDTTVAPNPTSGKAATREGPIS